MSSTKQQNWLPLFLIGWNVFDVVLHLGLGIIEPLRLTGNAVGILVAVWVLAGFGRKYAPHLLALSAVVLIILSTIFFSQVGFRVPSLIFIGTHLFMLLRYAQMKAVELELALTPRYLSWWMALIGTAVGLLPIVAAGLSSQSQPAAVLRTELISYEQTDTTPESSLPTESDAFLAAFFGLDNDMPPVANRSVCDGAAGADGMPLVLSAEIDPDTLQAGDFLVTSASGTIGSIHCVTLAPAIDEGELRTVLLVGEFGSAESNPPATVQVVGNLHAIDHTLNFKGATIGVTPLEPGPSLVVAEIVPVAGWNLGRESDGTWGSSNGCPASGVQQIVRVTWDGGVTLENGEEVTNEERVLYQVAVQGSDGAIRAILPYALGDLDDGDNNHELCLDTLDRPIAVSFPAGHFTDPNHDLNSATEIQLTNLP
ncbi:MAG: hypothetical protein AAGD96_13085 [Chloroflexota bacterium]